MKKKEYQAPSVTKVRLEIKNAVLGLCHTSPELEPFGDSGCKVNPGCWVSGNTP